MKGAKDSLRGAVTVGALLLLSVWMVVLSIRVGTGHRTMAGLADQKHVDSGQRQVQVLQVRIAQLAESVQMLQAQPEFVTVAALRKTRQRLETRLTRMERALTDRSAAEELQALRTEVEQMKTRLQPAPTVPQPPAKPITPAAVAKPSPFPFRIIGAEMRAWQHSVSVAPIKGELTADKIQVVLPGEAVGPWRLHSIEANTAVFQNGKQTRRLLIPKFGAKP